MKKNIQKLLAAVLAMAMAFALAACGATTGTNSPAEGSTSPSSTDGGAAGSGAEGGRVEKVVLAANADPSDLTPIQPGAAVKQEFFWVVYETLFDYDEAFNLVPNLAKSYEVVSDDTWNVTLFKDIYDSDGNHITADDVVFSTNWLIESGNNIRYDEFASVEKVDEYTVAYHWNGKPSATGVEWPLTKTFIFSEKAIEAHNFATDPCATGSYRVVSFTSGSSVVMEAKDDYWADSATEDLSGRLPYHKANAQTYELQIIPEASQAVVGLEMGSIDICEYVPFSMLDEFREGGACGNDYDVVTKSTSTFFVMIPNFASSVIGDDLNLRLAIYYALDNDTIATAMTGDYAPLKAMGSDYYSDYDPAWETTPSYINTCDTELAKDYLAKSNYNGEDIVVVCLNTEEVKNACVMMQALLENVGIHMKIEAYENSTLSTIYNEQANWDILCKDLAGSTLVATWNTLFNNNIHSGYTTSWLQDDTMQALYEKGVAEPTSENLDAMYDYAYSIGACYAFASASSSIVVSKDISQLVYRVNAIQPGGSIFN